MKLTDVDIHTIGEEATANALENIAAYLGIGGFNGATSSQLEERIKAEFDRLKPREWQELSEEEKEKLYQEGSCDSWRANWDEDYTAISAALRAKNGG